MMKIDSNTPLNHLISLFEKFTQAPKLAIEERPHTLSDHHTRNSIKKTCISTQIRYQIYYSNTHRQSSVQLNYKSSATKFNLRKPIRGPHNILYY